MYGKTFAEYFKYSFDFIPKTSCLKYQLEIDANLKVLYLNLEKLWLWNYY